MSFQKLVGSFAVFARQSHNALAAATAFKKFKNSEEMSHGLRSRVPSRGTQQPKLNEKREQISSAEIWEKVQKLKQDLNDMEQRHNVLEEFVHDRRHKVKKEESVNSSGNPPLSSHGHGRVATASGPEKESSQLGGDAGADQLDVIDRILSMRDWLPRCRGRGSTGL